MYTNGVLMRGERLRKLMPHLASLTVSVDGATKATFEHIRTGAKFEQVVENVAEFARLRRELGLRDDIRYAFNVVLMRENIDELAQIVELAAANDVDMVTACFVIVTSEAIRASSPTSCPERTNAALAKALAVADRLGIRTEFPLALPLDGAAPSEVEVPVLAPSDGTAASEEAFETHLDDDAMATPSSCATSCDSTAAEPSGEVVGSGTGPPAGYRGAYYCDMAWRKVFVAVGGEVMPCCSPTRPILGNAFETPFEDIWNGAEYQRLRRGLYTGELTSYCRKCPYLQQSGALPYARKE
jgi:radical SAM protein with 4Fe4S-binding SPASM domain